MTFGPLFYTLLLHFTVCWYSFKLTSPENAGFSSCFAFKVSLIIEAHLLLVSITIVSSGRRLEGEILQRWCSISSAAWFWLQSYSKIFLNYIRGRLWFIWCDCDLMSQCTLEHSTYTLVSCFHIPAVHSKSFQSCGNPYDFWQMCEIPPSVFGTLWNLPQVCWKVSTFAVDF